jgi:D-cysteine desulfhydrase family pyridoxal phosphate-dependent enzyme
MKRDDQTGLAFGGNKTRKLEYIIADAIDKKSDTIITWGGVQSNWCRQTAAAASMAGMRSILILSKKDASSPSYEGNLLLDAILGADIRLAEPGDDRAEIARQIAEEEHGKGRMPYVVSVGGSHTGGSMEEPLGAISYTNTFLEIYQETQEKKIKINHIVHATGSGGTQGGLCAGAVSVDPRISIVGISIGGSKAAGQKNIAEIAGTTLEALNLRMPVSPEDVIVFDDYVGGGYGILNQETVDAILLLARKEGILLDPVYTGKAMSGLIDLIQKKYFKKDDNVVFIHTGGTPALFPYGQELLEYLRKGDISYYKEFYKLA